MRSTSDDPVDCPVLSGTEDIFVLHFPIIICEEMLISDGINVGVARGFDGGSNETIFMLFGVDREGAEKLLGLVKGFFDGEGPFGPVDRGVDFFQPRESEDYIFIS